MSAHKKYDVLTIGRSSIDLYSNDVGVPFEEISSFGAFVGGSSTNIAVSCSRLGLRTALLTAVGDDVVGKFIKKFLVAEGVDTAYIPTIEGTRSSAVLLGIEPPDRFPLVFYRENAADLQLSIDHISAASMGNFHVVVLSGNALSKDPSKTSTFYGAEEAKKGDARVFLDLDFRADQWFDVRAYGVMIRAILPRVDIAIGTEEEVIAASLTDPEQIKIRDQQISAPEIKGDVRRAIADLLNCGVKTLVVKRGPAGASIYTRGEEEIPIPGFEVEILNVLGAGDAFAGGLLYGYRKGWDLRKAVRFANACGAILVTKQGCANFMPTLPEVMNFIDLNGGI